MATPKQVLDERVRQGRALEQAHRLFLDSLGISGKRHNEMERAGVRALDPLLGPSSESERVREKIRRLAESDLPVLVHGPPGTAKNVVAALVHFASSREGAFRQIDVASVPDRDAAELLFGCVAGYRGQGLGRIGLVFQCHRGSLLLSRVDLASEYMQRLAVGVAEEKKRFLRRVGSDVPIVAELPRLRAEAELRRGDFGQRVIAERSHGNTPLLPSDQLIGELCEACRRAGIRKLETELAKLRGDDRRMARFATAWNATTATDGRACETDTNASKTWVRVIDSIEDAGEIDLRVLATADVDLGKHVERGTFRRDLYDNLSGSIIQLPSLNERGKEEIAAFVGYGLRVYATQQKVTLRGLDSDYDAKLLEADWSANNLRGLRNEIRRAIAYLRRDGIVTEADQHYESTVKAKMGISALGVSKQNFKSMDGATRRFVIAEALTQTISPRWPKGSVSAARRVLSKKDVEVSLQTVLNYIHRKLIRLDARQGRYVVFEKGKG